MPIKLGDKTVTPYKGDHKPVNIYYGAKKVAGWVNSPKSGTSMSWDDTYRDKISGIIKGKTVQTADYVAKDGLSNQTVTVQGKNKFDYTKAYSLAHSLRSDIVYQTKDGRQCIYFPTGFANADNLLTNFAFAENTQYTIQFDYYQQIETVPSSGGEGFLITYTDSSTSYCVPPATNINGWYKRTTTTATGKTVSKITWIYGSSAIPTYIDVNTIQLEVGSTATSYESFIPDSPSLNYPSSITPNVTAGTYKITGTFGIYEVALPHDLRGVTSQDRATIDRDSGTGWLITSVAPITANGTEAWHKSTAITTVDRYYITDTGSKLSGDIKSTHFAKVTSASNATGCYLSTTSAGYLVIQFALSEGISTVDLLKTWLAANLPISHVELATPVRTALTFTKVASSTASEFPATSIATTASQDYPWYTYDVNGNVISSEGRNLFDISKVITSADVVNHGDYLQINTRPTSSGVSAAVPCHLKDYAPSLEVGKTYTLSALTTGSDKYLYLSLAGVGWTFGTSKTITQAILDSTVYFYASGNSTTAQISKIQIELGSVVSPYIGYKVPSSIALPILRSAVDATDTYNLTTGKKAQNISDWVVLDGSKNISLMSSYSTFKRLTVTDFFDGNIGTTNENILCVKYNSALIPHGNTASAPDLIEGANTTTTLCISVSNDDTGWSQALVPTSMECKAYCYGWKMCHSDGSSPYYKSEVPYTPDTWAEWTKSSGVTADSTGLLITHDDINSQYIKMFSLAFKNSTKYGVLYNIVSNNTVSDTSIGAGSSAFVETAMSKTVGNHKLVLTSKANADSLQALWIYSYKDTAGNTLKLKDIRIYEIPTGSQIEADFTNNTADELNVLYPFYGLYTKCWKHVTDGQGLISTLPTASYVGYTPYKMMYQLATPIETQLDLGELSTYARYTTVEQTGGVLADMDLTAKVVES